MGHVGERRPRFQSPCSTHGFPGTSRWSSLMLFSIRALIGGLLFLLNFWEKIFFSQFCGSMLSADDGAVLRDYLRVLMILWGSQDKPWTYPSSFNWSMFVVVVVDWWNNNVVCIQVTSSKGGVVTPKGSSWQQKGLFFLTKLLEPAFKLEFPAGSRNVRHRTPQRFAPAVCSGGQFIQNQIPNEQKAPARRNLVCNLERRSFIPTDRPLRRLGGKKRQLLFK